MERIPITGGVNNIVQPEDIEDGVLSSCSNIYIDGTKLKIRTSPDVQSAISSAISSALSTVYYISELWYIPLSKRPTDMISDYAIFAYGIKTAGTPLYRIHMFYQKKGGTWSYYAGASWSTDSDYLSGIYNIVGIDLSTKRNVRFNICGDKMIITDGLNPAMYVNITSEGTIDSGINQIYGSNEFCGIDKILNVRWDDANLGASIPSGSIIQSCFSLKTSGGAISGSSPISTRNETGGLWISPISDNNPGFWQKYIKNYSLTGCKISDQNGGDIAEDINGIIVGRRSFTYSESAENSSVVANVGTVAINASSGDSVSVRDGFTAGTEDILSVNTVPPAAVDASGNSGIVMLVNISEKSIAPSGDGQTAQIQINNQNNIGYVSSVFFIRLTDSVLPDGIVWTSSPSLPDITADISKIRIYDSDLKTPIPVVYQIDNNLSHVEIQIRNVLFGPGSTHVIYLVYYDSAPTGILATPEYGLWQAADNIAEEGGVSSVVFEEPIIRDSGDIIVSRFGERDRLIDANKTINLANRNNDADTSGTKRYSTTTMGRIPIPVPSSNTFIKAKISNLCCGVNTVPDEEAPSATFSAAASGTDPHGNPIIILTVSTQSGVHAGDYIYLSDCTNTSYNSQDGNAFEVSYVAPTQIAILHNVAFSSTFSGTYTKVTDGYGGVKYLWYRYWPGEDFSDVENVDKYTNAQLVGNSSPANIYGWIKIIDIIAKYGTAERSIFFADVSQWHHDFRQNHCRLTGWWFGVDEITMGAYSLYTGMSFKDESGNYGIKSIIWDYTVDINDEFKYFLSIDFNNKSAFLVIFDTDGFLIHYEYKTGILDTDEEYLPPVETGSYRRALMLSPAIYNTNKNCWYDEWLSDKPNSTTNISLCSTKFLIDDFVYSRGSYHGPEDLGNIIRIIYGYAHFPSAPIGVNYWGELDVDTQTNGFGSDHWSFDSGSTWSGLDTSVIEHDWPSPKESATYDVAISSETLGYNDYYIVICEVRGTDKVTARIYLGEASPTSLVWNTSNVSDWVLNINYLQAYPGSSPGDQKLYITADPNLSDAGELYIRNLRVYRTSYFNNITFGPEVIRSSEKYYPNKIVWSDLNSLSFPKLNSRTLPEEAVAVSNTTVYSDNQQSLAAFLIWTRNNIYQFALSGQIGDWTSSVGNLATIDSNVGLYLAGSLIGIGSGYYWLSDSGFIKWSPSEGIANISKDRYAVPQIGSGTGLYTDISVAYDSKNQLIIWCFYTSTTSKSLVYDVYRQVWCGEFTNFKFTDSCGLSGNSGSDNGTYLLNGNNIYKFPGTSQTSEVGTITTKKIYHTGILCNAFRVGSDNKTDVSVTTYKQYSGSTAIQSYTGVTQDTLHFIKNARGNAIKLTVSGSGATEINKIELDIKGI